MKKLILITTLILGFGYNVPAEIILEMGRISMAELQMKTYEKDPDAEAVKIFDMGQSDFIQEDGGFNLRFTRKVRIKVLDDAGLDYAEVSIPVYRDRDAFERVEDIIGASYRYENGKVIKKELGKKDFHIEKINEVWSKYKFVIPDVQKGSVIEYSYRLISPRLFYLKDWEFQCEIPTIYSQYIAKMIPFYEYIFIMKGTKAFDVKDSYVPGIEHHYGGIDYKEKVYKFGMKDVPAFRDESFITSRHDYINAIDFQLATIYFPNGGTKEIKTTWEQMIDDFIKEPEFGKYIKKSEKYAGKLFDVEKVSAMPSTEKYEYVVDYVKSNYSWNGFWARYSTKKVKELVKEKSGAISDINLLLTGLLRAVGFEAYPVMLSTRENGKIYRKYPFVDFFDYIVVYVKDGNRSYLTDAVDYTCDDRRIPEKCLNDVGLIIKPGKVQWVDLTTDIVSEYNRTITLNVEPESCKAEVLVVASEYEAQTLRKRIYDDTDKLKHYYEENCGSEIDSVRFIRNAKERNKPYIAAFTSDVELTRLEDKIYVSPFLSFAGVDNPFKQKERSLPVDLVKRTSHTFKSSIKLPEGYVVDFKPLDKKVDNSIISINYKVEESKKNELNLVLTYEFKKKEYPASSYNGLKAYYDIILEKANENIVLRKANADQDRKIVSK